LSWVSRSVELGRHKLVATPQGTRCPAPSESSSLRGVVSVNDSRECSAITVSAWAGRTSSTTCQSLTQASRSRPPDAGPRGPVRRRLSRVRRVAGSVDHVLALPGVGPKKRSVRQGPAPTVAHQVSAGQPLSPTDRTTTPNSTTPNSTSGYPVPPVGPTLPPPESLPRRTEERRRMTFVQVRMRVGS